MHPLMLPVTFETLRFAAVMVLGFVLALFLGARFLPGLERKGYPQPDGSRKEYSLTGMTLFFMTHIALGVATFGFGVTLTPIVTHFWSICIVANIFAVVVSLVLYASALERVGRQGKAVLKYPHPEGNRLPETVQDLWFGAELNPTWFGVDMKMFLYQTSLIGVYLIVLSFSYAQHDTYGVLTPQMVCLVAFWFAYLFTHYVKEEFMLSTWDVISENFGFMLVWGDLVYVPFLYSLPGWWLITPEGRRFLPPALGGALRVLPPRALDFSRSELAEGALQTRQRHRHLGQAGGDDRGAIARFGMVGHRAKGQLRGGARGLSRVRDDHRRGFHPAVPPPSLAHDPPRPARRTGRQEMSRQIR